MPDGGTRETDEGVLRRARVLIAQDHKREAERKAAKGDVPGAREAREKARAFYRSAIDDQKTPRQ